ASRDSQGIAARGGNRKFGDSAGRSEPPDLVAKKFGKPEVPVGANRDKSGPAAGGGCELSDKAGRRSDPTDQARTRFGKPQTIITSGTGCDAVKSAPIAEWGDLKFGEPAGGGNNPPYFVDLGFDKPKVAIRPRCNIVRPTVGCGNRKLGKAAGQGHPPDLVILKFRKPEITV